MPRAIARPPKGFRDFRPEVMILRKQLIRRLERVFELYGYDPIDTPILEYWETLAGKYGEEAENRLIWRFEDPWSGRKYALRYDLTVPLARFVANNQDIPLPFRRYHIGPVWRHEEPQKGRYREFYQCDADIVGSPYPEADAEIVNLTVDALKSLGFSDGFRVRLNDRRLLRGIFEEELAISDPLPVYRAIDKLDKIGVDGVKGELTRLGLSSSLVGKIMDIISISGDYEDILVEVRRKYGPNKLVTEAVDHLEEMIKLIIEPKSVQLDLSLVRGLDYYTGPILEVTLDKPRIGSVAGGGRYDNLIGVFLKREIPATGVSIGIERIIDAGLELGIYRIERRTVADVQVIVMSAELYGYAWRIAAKLREAGLSTRIDVGRVRESTQRKHARKLGIPVLIFIGLKEFNSNTVTVYIPGEALRHEMLGIDEAIARIKRYLGIS